MKEVLEKLSLYQSLTSSECETVMDTIISGGATGPQVSALMMAYRMRFPSASEIKGFRNALLRVARNVNVPAENTIDIVGTGGDGKNTFNISTLSSFVVAGAGYKVVKHGNYGSSSVSGSSNTLQNLGCQFTNDEGILLHQLEKANICFLHAPLFHPALKDVAPIRKAFGLRSFFNLLGPLLNPIEPQYQLFGTSSLEISRLYVEVMAMTDRSYTIVHALDGYDEVSLTGPTDIRSDKVQTVLSPDAFDATAIEAASISGGETPDIAKQIFLNVLQGKATSEQEQVVLANAALAIQTLEDSQMSLLDAKAKAAESITSGAAFRSFNSFIEISQS